MKVLIPIFLVLSSAGCSNQNSKHEIAELEAKNRQLIEEIKKLNEKTTKIEDIEKRLKNIDSIPYYGIDAVVGPKGSKSQLLLSSVFFNGPSAGLVSGEELKEFQTGKFKRYVTYAIPIAVGDNFKDFQIVGTTHELFDLEYLPKKKHAIHKPGRLFNSDAQEAVIGSRAAIQLGLELGDIFQPCHGLKDNPHMKHDVDYVVVGILKPSNTPADKVIWIPIKGVQNMPGHDPGKAQHVSAIYLKMNEKYHLSFLSQNVNKNSQSMQIVPSKTKIILDEFNDLKEGLNLLKAALKLKPPKELTLEEKFAGIYEAKTGEGTYKAVLLENGVCVHTEQWFNGKSWKRNVQTNKWKIVDGEIHVSSYLPPASSYTHSVVYKINEDGSFTGVAIKEQKTDKRTDIPKEEQATYKKNK